MPAATCVHVPVRFRARLAGIMASTLTGLVQGDERASDLEQARSKLLLGPVPPHRNTQTELALRFDMWTGGRFEELLVRAEEQWHARVAARRTGRVGGAARLRARRAEATAREGAYRKAVMSLTSDLAQLSAGEERTWADKLLPCSARPHNACVATPPAPRQAGEGRAPPRRALEGVRFAALSAPGPSGARPEHLRDALAARPRAAATRLYQAVSALHAAALAGDLPECARWILASRLVYLKKKNGEPRPVRVGELWRRIVAKRLAHDLRQAAQAIFLNARQFGIAMPCGTDALVHFRATLEEALRADDNEALAVLDLDLRNAFPSLEWDAIRASVARHMPSLLPWITWSHGQPSPVHLPSGGVKWVDRGAEQGDPLGSILCGLVVIDVMIRTRARVQKCLEDEDGYAHLSHDVVLRLFDAWFMDDGQVVLPPNLVDLFLRALDEELAAVGATHGQGEGVKSVARLVGSPRAVAAIDGAWATDCIRSTCRMPASTVPPHVLGVDVGGDAVATAQVMEELNQLW